MAKDITFFFNKHRLEEVSILLDFLRFLVLPTACNWLRSGVDVNILVLPFLRPLVFFLLTAFGNGCISHGET